IRVSDSADESPPQCGCEHRVLHDLFLQCVHLVVDHQGGLPPGRQRRRCRAAGERGGDATKVRPRWEQYMTAMEVSEPVSVLELVDQLEDAVTGARRLPLSANVVVNAD